MNRRDADRALIQIEIASIEGLQWTFLNAVLADGPSAKPLNALRNEPNICRNNSNDSQPSRRE